MNRILKISVSVILAVFLIIGTFSTGMATDNPEVSAGTDLAYAGTTEDASAGVEVIPPDAEPATSEPEPETVPAQPAAEPESGEPAVGTDTGGNEGQEGGLPAEPAVHEKKELKLDAGNGYTIASDSAFLDEAVSLSVQPWKEGTRSGYKETLDTIAETENELLTVSVRNAEELPYIAEAAIEVYINNKEWNKKSVKDLEKLNLKVYLSDEKGKLNEVKTEIKKNKEGAPAVFFKTARLADILVSAVKVPDETPASPEAKSAGEKPDEAVDVSEHPLAETEASDSEPLLQLSELNPGTRALLRTDGLLKAGEDDGDGDEEEPSGGVSEDGITIEKISIKWLSKSTGETEPAGQGTLNLETDSASVGNQQFQIDFAISGKDDHEPGTVELIIPADIWLDRYGNEPGNLTLSVPEEPGEGADFAWKRVGDNIVITNVRRLSAASKVMIQGTFRNVKPYDMVDKDVSPDSDYASAANTGVSNDLSATVGITTPNDNYISMTSNSINATIDTHIEAASATKSAYNTTRREYYVYHSPDLALSEGSIPQEFIDQLDDPSQYSFVRWYVSGSATGSQPFKMVIKDTFNGTVVHYLDALHQQSETLNVSGKMLGVQGALVPDGDGEYKTGNVVSTDGQTVSAVLYDGYSTLSRSAYVWTAYKQSEFPDTGDDYSVSNTQTTEVTGWDDKITTTKEATASTPFRTPIIYTIKKVWDDGDNAAGHRPSSLYFNINYTDDAGTHYGSHSLTADEGWEYSWSDLGHDRKYSAYESTSGGIFSDHVIPGSKHTGEDEYGAFVEYDVWWYDRQSSEYDSNTHTWITTNKYKERHVKLYEIPFAVPSTYAYMDKSTNSYTNSSRTAKSDRALNILRRGDDVIVSYKVSGYAQTMGYTLGNGLNPSLITSYGQKEVTLELEDNYREDVVGTAVNNSLLFDDTIRLTLDDAEIAYVTLNSPSFEQYGQYGYNAPSGTPASDFVYYGWSFKSVSLTDPPVEKLMGLRNGEWVEFATIKGSAVTPMNGATASGRQINLPSGVEKVKTVLTVPTSDPADQASWAQRVDKAGMSYNVGIRLLGDSQTLKNRLTAVFEQNDYGMCTLDNFATLNIYGDNVNLPRSITDWSRAWLHGRNHRVAVRAEKSFEMVENDLIKRQLKLHSTVNMIQQSNVLERNEYDEARAEGLIPSTESGTWYDLLPLGVMPDTESVRLTNGDKITDVYTVENYKDSGRILLVVKAEVAPHISYQNANDPNPYKNDDTYPKEGYKDVHTLEFDAYYSWDEARLYGLGSTVRNVAAYESDENALGNINGWSGEPDDPQRNHNQRAMDAVGDDKLLMTGLDPDRIGEHTAFVYAGSVLKSEEIDFMAATELRKYVTKDGLGVWSTGRDGSTQVTVNEGGYYTYMLYVCSDGETTTKNMIFLDTLENYVPGESDDIDYQHGRWQGEFVSIDTSEFEALGMAPVIYYSTSVPDLEELKGQSGKPTPVPSADYVHDYLTNPANGWTTACPADKSTVKAIAIDIRKKTDGADYELAPDESIFCTVRMKAKVYETTGTENDPFNADAEKRKQAANNDYAYNNIFLGCTQVDPIGQETHAVINYNYTRVGIVPFEYKVKKVWNDADNNDGKRPNELTVHLLANGQRMNPDRTITLNESNGWEGRFEHVIQYDESGNWINYTFEEESADPNPAFNLNGYTMGTEKKGENVTLTNTYTPEKTQVKFKKEWTGDDTAETSGYRPEKINVRLMADGVFTGKVLEVKPDRNGVWSGTFTNLPVYSNPSGLSGNQKEIEYTVEEEPVYRYEDSYSYNSDTDTFEITNTYYPYGDLQVSKKTTGVTEKSKDKEFTYTLLLKDSEGNELTEKYAYTKYDPDGNETTGTIGNGDTFTLVGDGKIVIKDIPSESTYQVAEDETAGFSVAGTSGTQGMIRAGATQEAKYTNMYEAEGSQTLSLKKTLEGRTMSRYQFRFELVDRTEGSDTNGVVISTTSADQNGDAVFGRLSYTAADHGKTFSYEIREVDREKPGYTYDKTTYKVDVTVTDNGDGTMTCDPKYYKADGTPIEAKDITFENTYKAKGDIKLKAWKQLPAGTLAADQFSFELLKVNTDMTSEEFGTYEVIQTKKNDANGTISFDALNFTEADAGKTYFYVIREVNEAVTTIIYDETLKGIELQIADNGDGTLAVSQENVHVVETDTDPVLYVKGEKTQELPVFVNGLVPGNLSLTKLTTWDGSEPNGDQEFSFILTLVGDDVPEEINVQKSEVENAKTYTAHPPTPLTEDEKQWKTVSVENGEYRFTLKAGQKLTVKDLPAGTAYQFQEDIPVGWTLTFENVAGTIAPQATQPAVYTNKYEPGKAVATVLATKRMDGRAPDANKFAFQLVDDNKNSATYGQVLQELPNHASGFVLFDVEYDDVEGEGPDTYHYLIREVQKPVKSVENGVIKYSEDEDELRKIQFDENEYGVTVTVSKVIVDGNITLTAKVQYDNADNTPPQFINETRPGSLQISKMAEGLTEANKDAVFTFKVSFSNDAGMPLDEGKIVYYTQDSEAEDQSATEPIPDTPSQPENAEPETAESGAKSIPVNTDRSRQKEFKAVRTDNRVLREAGDTKADPSVSRSGTLSTTVKWTFYSDGTLIIEPVDGVYGSFAGVNSTNTSDETKWPWYSFRSSIKKVQVRGQVDVTVGTAFMFRSCGSMTVADLDGLYSTPTTKSAHRMFNNCNKLDYLNIQHFIITSNMANSTAANMYLEYRSSMQMIIVGPGNMYQLRIPGGPWKNISNAGNYAGQSLSYIGGLKGADIEGTWVKGNYNPSFTIVFDGNGATGSMDPITGTINNRPVLPDNKFLSDLNFAGWATDKNAVIPEYTAGQVFTGLLTEGQTVTLYAVWMSDEDFLIHYEANGGYVTPQWQRVHGSSSVVNMPTPTHPNNYEFLYWTTNQDGSGARYSRAAVGSDFNAQPGQTVTLYAQFVDPNAKGSLTIEHYLQNTDLSGYSLVGANPLGAYDLGAEVTPPGPNGYKGFIKPSVCTVLAGSDTTGVQQAVGTDVTIVKGGVTVRYYYDRTHYTVAFDANTGEGTMGSIEMTGGVSAKLPVSRFTKENSIFVGWNTASDGSGISYGDGQSINSIGGDGETVTLYAQWFDLEDAPVAEPTNGEYTVTCKANETIVFPQLPAGTHYTVTEVQLPDGWSLKNTENGTGTVLSAERVNVKATNKYSATGKADIVARKALPGETMTSGQFTFQLLDEEGNVVQSKGNGTPDDMEETLDADGNTIPNPNYGTANVYFDTITYDKQGVYKYTIKEIKGSDPSIDYDGHTEHVTVYVTDRGDGRLTTSVMYDESGANFKNKMSSGDLKVSKTIRNATAAAAESEFFFTLYLKDSTGKEIKTEYDVEKTDGTKTKIKSGGAVSIKGGQSFTVKGLPHNSTYTVVEGAASGFEQVGSENTEGTIFAGRTAEASFENAYSSKTTGGVGGAVIEAKKVFENADIKEKQFKFRLLDSEMEEIETVYAETDGTITFSPMDFTLEDDGQRYVYYIEEIKGNEDRVTYDTHRERVAIEINDNGDGTMKAEVVYATGETPVFTNVFEPYKTSVSGKKTWNDGNNRDGKRPSSIMVRLMADGEEVAMKTVTSKDGWKYTFDDLLKYDADGNEIRYTVAEGKVSGYSVKYDGYNITNSYTPGKVNVPVTKVWKDNNDEQGIRPSSITVRLYADAADTGKTLTLSAGNSWSGSFDGLDEYKAGRKIDYTVREDSVEGYTTELKGDAASGYTIINTATPAPPEEPSSDTPRRTTPRRTRTRRSSSGEVRHNYRSARRNMILRKTADGYVLIEDNGVPLAKFPTGDEIQLMIMIAVAAAAAGVIIWIALLGRRKKKESR